MKTTGDRIRYIRKNILNLKGEEFGEKLNVTKVAVSNWENNNRTPDVEMLVKIAELGNVSVDWLLCRTNNPNAKVYEGYMDDEHIEIEINKNYPHELLPEEVQKLIDQLKEVGFDVNTLINNIKDKDKNK